MKSLDNPLIPHTLEEHGCQFFRSVAKASIHVGITPRQKFEVDAQVIDMVEEYQTGDIIRYRDHSSEHIDYEPLDYGCDPWIVYQRFIELVTPERKAWFDAQGYKV